MKTRCPCCGTTASLDVLVAHADARAALAVVFKLSQPLGSAMVRYLSLFRPATRELTMARIASLLGELLPDLAASTIQRKGRTWLVTEEDWCLAIEQMMLARDAGKLTLPLTGHGYLLEVMAGLADKVERLAEQGREAALRTRGQATVTVRGEAMNMGQALQTVFGRQDPALAKLDYDATQVVPQSDAHRASMAALRARAVAQGGQHQPKPVLKDYPHNPTGDAA